MAKTPLTRERTILSARLIVPTRCCGGFNEKAIRFRQSINSSISMGRLEPELAVKALGDGFGIRKKSYEDTDGKKREFTGDTRPGVDSNEAGYRWEKSRTWEPGSRLVISPSFMAREGMRNTANVGWIPEDKNKPKSFDEMLQRIAEKPQIQLRKFKVNSKNDDIIPESETLIDPFGISSGMSIEERRAADRKRRGVGQEEKMLPGRSLASRVPGGSLLARAAAAFGVLRDENNKFRCPPGTPAANQFTDATGSNCFGFSASRFARYAARQAAKMTEEGQYSGLRQSANSFFNFLYNDVASADRRGKLTPERAGRVAYWADLAGDRIKAPEWRDIPVPENLRLFKNGAVRGQDDIARQKANVTRLYDSLGIDPNDPDAPAMAVEALRRMHVESGGRAGWDLEMINVSKGGDSSRLTELEVRKFTEARLKSVPGWPSLTKEEQQRLIDSDVSRYQDTERAMLETLLDQFMQNPASTRFIGKIEYDFFSDDEAGTGVYREAPALVPRLNRDGTPVLDRDGNPVMRKVPGELRSVIHINMGQILQNQESMLPNMRPDERLAISAVGARSEAESRLAVADFLVNADHTARGMAGLIDGVYGFSSHIMLHEMSHSIQAQVFVNKVQQAIDADGFISVPLVRNGVVVGTRNVDSIYALNGDDIMAIMTDVADDINLDSLNNAMQRIKDVAPIAGSYPRDVFSEGSEVWALEVAAELWALRERGIIYGDDIDAALAFMDDAVRDSAAIERADWEDFDAMSDLDRVFTPRPMSPVSEDIPEEDVDEILADREERMASALRDEIKRFKTEFESLSDAEMLSEAAIIASQRDAAEKKLKAIRELVVDPSLPDDERNAAENLKEMGMRDAEMEFGFFDTKYNEALKGWRKKYGIGARGEKKRFEDAVRDIREREGLFDDETMAEIARAASLDDLRDSVSKMDSKKITRRIADDEVRLKTMDPTSDDAKKLAEEIDIIRDQYVKNIKESGDKRTSAQIKKELDKNVEELITPPAKKSKKFKDPKSAKDHAVKERRRVKATEKQKAAARELGDVSTSDVGALLDPKLQTRAGRAINKRNARLKRLGHKVDENSSQEADVVQQVENLLIPTMEMIDGTSVGEPFEMEAVIDFEPVTLKGKMTGKEVDVQQFVSGKLVTSRMKKADIPERGKKDSKTGRTSRRVIIQVREGDRGIFPRTGEGEQTFVAPPGKLRIVGRDSDGTIRAEISYQMDSVEVVDTVANSLDSNKTDAIWAKSHSKKIQAVADKYVAAKRSSGEARIGPRSDYDKTSELPGRESVDEVVEAGGSFGEGMDEIPEHLKETRTRLSSGKVDALGMPATREERTKSRRSSISAEIRQIKDILGGGRGESSNPLTRADIDPEVAKLISETPEEILIDRIEETAYRMHSGFDRRVRVRATDEDIANIVSTGVLRSPMSSPSDEDTRVSRRATRRADMGGRLSSGRTIESSESLKERRRQEREVATRALDVFDDIISGGKNVNEMSEQELAEKFGTKVKRSGRSSISQKDSNLYEVDDIPTAVAMMMLGHHVEVNSKDIRLTEQAQKDFESMIKDTAKKHIKDNHPAWQRFQDKFAADNPELDLDDPDVVKQMESEYVGNYQADLCSLYNPANNLMCSGHIGIDREKMPQTNGRTSGHDTQAVKALKAGHAAGKWEPASNISPSREVETEFADELDSAVRKENAKREKSGKAPVSDEEIPKILYGIVSEKHSLRNELGGTKASEHREKSYSKLSDTAKEWLYSNTNWNDTEVNLETPFIDWLNETIKVSDPDNGPAVRRRSVNPAEYAPSQQQLVASKVDGTAKTVQEEAVRVAEAVREANPGITGEAFREKFLEEMGKQWFMQPILTTKDGFILDGHHRWAGIVVANRSLSEDMQLPLSANEVQTDIVEGLTLGKVFQDAWGIKEARLGAELPWKEGQISDISAEEISGIQKGLTSNAPQLIDELYERGDYVQLGSVGMKNDANYASAVEARQRLARTRRPSREAIERERQLDEAIRKADLERISRGGQGRESVGRIAKLRKSRKSTTPNSSRLSSGKTVGLSSDNYAREYYSRIGLPESLPNDLLPVSGYLVHKSHLDARRKYIIKSKRPGSLLPDADYEISDRDVVGDGLTAIGDMEIVLRPSVSNRVSYGRGNSLSSAHRPVMLNSRNREDVADALINADGMDGESRKRDAMLGLLSSSITNDFSNVNQMKIGSTGDRKELPREPFEAQILGGFDLSDIEKINVPLSKIEAMSESEDISDVVDSKSIAEKLRSAGFSPEEIQYFYSIGGAQSLNTQSMSMLRKYRASQKFKKDMTDKGVQNVGFVTPDGLNIDDPRSHAKSVKPGQSVEDVLKKEIDKEILKEAQDLLGQMKKSSKPTIISSSGGRL